MVEPHRLIGVGYFGWHAQWQMLHTSSALVLGSYSHCCQISLLPCSLSSSSCIASCISLSSPHVFCFAPLSLTTWSSLHNPFNFIIVSELTLSPHLFPSLNLPFHFPSFSFTLPHCHTLTKVPALLSLRWTGRWTSSSRTAAWTSTIACSRSCCSSNTWCGASVMSGSTSNEQVRE